MSWATGASVRAHPPVSVRRVHAPLGAGAALDWRRSVWGMTCAGGNGGDDGIVLTLADGDDPPDIASLVPDPEEIEERIIAELARSPQFASSVPRERRSCPAASAPPSRTAHARCRPATAGAEAHVGGLQFPAFPIVMETVPLLSAGHLRRAGAAEVACVARNRARGAHPRGGDGHRYPPSRARSCSPTWLRTCTRVTSPAG
jgi:hypothetical protein